MIQTLFLSCVGYGCRLTISSDFLGDNLCNIKWGERAAPVELDLTWTTGVHLAVGQSPLKRRAGNKPVERHSDTPRSEGQ